MIDQNKPKGPSNYLAVAIITTILCCLPAGIVSIVYAAKVNGLYDDGQYAEAEQASKNAKTWAIVSAIVGVVVIGGSYLLGGLALLSSGNF